MKAKKLEQRRNSRERRTAEKKAAKEAARNGGYCDIRRTRFDKRAVS